jgi:hypothetical protein
MDASDLKSKRIVIMDKEHFTVDLEYNKDFAILHLPRCDKINKDLLVELTMRAEELYEFFTTIGYENLWSGAPIDQTTIHKLLSKIGFVHEGEAQGIKVFRYVGEE